jgi:hypothetical protein
MKSLKNFDDYRLFLAKNFSDNWRNAKSSSIAKVFGLPKKYPCFAYTEYLYDDDEFWGDGSIKVCRIKYVE